MKEKKKDSKERDQCTERGRNIECGDNKDKKAIPSELEPHTCYYHSTTDLFS